MTTEIKSTRKAGAQPGFTRLHRLQPNRAGRSSLLPGASRGFFAEISRGRTLYAMTVPALLFVAVFSYFPMAGLVVAFKNYSYAGGIFGSPWVGFKNFEFLFVSEKFSSVLRNTLILNFAFLVFHKVFEVTVAVLLNEIRERVLKKFIQSAIFLPWFMSWIVVSAFAYNILRYETGSLNALLRSLGGAPVNVFDKPMVWPPILLAASTWKYSGFGVIIYLATIVGIAPEYYEAALIDGASRLQRIRFITVPLLLPTVIILTILSIGRLMSADFGMFYALVGDNSLVYSTVDVIDTFVYRSLRQLGDVGMSSAVGFFQSVVGFSMVLSANAFARRFAPDGRVF